jgi:hypothetical protein
MGAALVVRPAALVQKPLKVVPVESVFITWFPEQETGVLMSVPLETMVTFPVYQPFHPSEPLRVMIAFGGVLSMLIPVCVLETVFPARSAQVPDTDRFVPSVERTWLTAAEAVPEVPSAQFQFTVTFVLFQPAAFGDVRPV